MLSTLICLAFSNASTTTKTKTCKFLPLDTVEKWDAEFQKPAYDIYRSFNDIPFPKELIVDRPFPETKHLLFNFGMAEGTEQNLYLFAVIGMGPLDQKLDLDYSTLRLFDKQKEEWVETNRDFFEGAKGSWRLYVESQQDMLPTLGYTVPNEDINICPHTSFDRIRFGIDNSSSNVNYWLKLYFHEGSMTGNDDVNFDACLPCPPTCLD